MTRRIAALLLVSLVAPLTACGGDDDDGDAGGDGGQLTKAEYIEAADEACQDNLDAGDALDVPEEGDAEGLARYLDDAVEIFEETRDRFADLDPPADAQEVHDGQLAQLREGVEILRRAADAAEQGDIEQAATIVGEIEADIEADQLAADYGLEVCGTQEATE